MAEHQALYRKWRPQQFAEVVNQTYAIQTLVNALSSKEIGHAYLFAGPRGTGKTTVARLFAKAVNCLQRQQGEPCNRCDACLRIAKGVSLDVVEIDGASNRGIDQIRKLREEVSFVPADVRYKVYIIDEVHMLTNEAFNALLKTLEEPPKRVVFIFATTEVHKLPATVTSRCQAFEFTRIAPEAVVEHLKQICQAEGIQADDRALQTIASRCGGALRDALVTLEQVAAYTQGEPISGQTLETVLGLPPETLLKAVLHALLEKNADPVLETLNDLAQRGRDLELFLEELIRLARRWLVQAVAKHPLPVSASTVELAALTDQLMQLKQSMGRVWDKQIWLEVGLLRWLHEGAAPQPQAAPAQVKDQDARSVPKSEKLMPDQHVPNKPKAQTTAPAPPQPSVSTASQGEQQAWKNLLEAIRDDRRVAVYAYLVEAHSQLKEDRLTILFDRQHRFHKESLEKAEIQSYVRDMAQSVYGRSVGIQVGFLENRQAAPTAEQPAQAPPPKPSQLDEKTELVKKIFDGKRLH